MASGNDNHVEDVANISEFISSDNLTLFGGIDLANGLDNKGVCFIKDDGAKLCPSLTGTESNAAIIAIDCPFGTTQGFEFLLSGVVPSWESPDRYKSRRTELWLEDEVSDYHSVRRWLGRSKIEKERHPKTAYFNSGGHIQPTLRMSIVPECIYFLLDRYIKFSDPRPPLALLQASRRGEGRFIEAHPRMFLYSFIERVYRLDPGAVSMDVLFDASKYKKSNASRRRIYEFMQSHINCVVPKLLGVVLGDPPDLVVENNHHFDAMLCALTAWAHHHGECKTWRDAEIKPNVVEIEGHILVLKQAEISHE